jgi:hypothetical protein
MSLNFTHEYECNRNKEPLTMTAEQIVDYVVSRSPDYHAGELETIRSELSKLQEVVAAIVSTLNDEQKRDVVSEIAWGWKEVDAAIAKAAGGAV